ncbi:MAG: tetraacyldisaccharide 4'-kinase [Pseudomonadota bacterium]
MKAPYFWSAGLDPRSREAAPLTRALLSPLAALYAATTARRQRTTRAVALPVPVICVGNVTSGGSGKTPIAAAIRAQLTSWGIRAATLSRGHGGRLTGPIQVAPSHTHIDVGDEPAMLSRTGESWIARNRGDGGEEMVRAGVEAIVMDDGHQNPQLEKTVSLLVIDAAAPFGNGHVLPKGPLREPVQAALERTDLVVVSGDGPVPAIVQRSGIRTIRSQLRRMTELPSGPIIAFAGIGRPEKFFASIEDGGGALVDAMSFPDHHRYRPRDIQNLRNLAEDHGATLVTTRKDHVRLPGPLAEGILPIDVQAEFEPTTAIDDLLRGLFKAQ